MKICAVTTTHGLGKWQNRRRPILSTWANDMDRYYLMSDDTLFGAIYVPGPENSHQRKMIMGIRRAMSEELWDWIISTCDDSYVHRQHLETFLEGKARDTVWGHQIRAWPIDRSLRYPSGACMIIPGPKALELCDVKVEDEKAMWPEVGDVWIGLRCRALGVPLGDTGELIQVGPDFKDPAWIAAHHITEDGLMEKIHKSRDEWPL